MLHAAAMQKTSNTSTVCSSKQASLQLHDSWGTTVIPAPFNDELGKPLLRISLDEGADRTLRVQDIPNLPLQEIAGLYTVSHSLCFALQASYVACINKALYLQPGRSSYAIKLIACDLPPLQLGSLLLLQVNSVCLRIMCVR